MACSSFYVRKKLSCFIFSIFFIAASCTSESESNWQGYLSQDDEWGISNKYTSVVYLKQTGDEIEGTMHLSVPSDTSLFVYYQLEGEQIGDTIFVKDSYIIEAAEIKGEWLTKDMKFYFVNKNEINGSWVGHRGKHSYGSIKLLRLPE